MDIEMIEELADLHCKLANLYADAADAAEDGAEIAKYETASMHHAELELAWQIEAERWHRCAAKMSAESTEYWDRNHDNRGNWTGPVRNENGRTL